MDILPPQKARRARHRVRRPRRRRPNPRVLWLVVVALAGGALVLPTLNAGGLATVDEVHYTFTGPTSVTFDWRGSADDLQYGTTTSYGNVVNGTIPSPAPISSSGPWWEATITGLTPGATYHYSIGGGDDATFTTAPTGDFRFTSVGDIGSSATYPRITTMQSLMAADSPDFGLILGDLTYGNNNGMDDVDQHFNDVMAWSTAAAYMPAWGNHEYQSPDDLRNYKGRFDIPNDAASTGAPPEGCCGEDWGWFDAGGVRFISYPEPYSGTTLSQWGSAADVVMDAAQTSSSIRFIVTFGHRSAYSTGSHGGHPTLAPILDGLGDGHSKYVLDLAGHNHDYERWNPIHGVTHIVAGTGGRSLAAWSSNDLSGIAKRARHFGHLRVDVTSTSITVQFVCGPSSTSEDVTCAQGSVWDTVVLGSSSGPTVPSAPVLTGTPGDQAAHLSWTTPFDGGSNIDGWKVYRGTSSGGEELLTTISNPNTDIYDDTGLTNGATYYYKVSATNSVGEGALSNEVARTPTAATVPSAPSLAATAESGVVHLLWSTPFDGGSPITGYTVYRGLTPGSGGSLATVPAGTTSFDDTTVVAGTTYYYTVTATNAIGEGLRSNEVSATPPASTATAPTAPLNLKALRRSFGILLRWSLPASDGGSPITGYKIYRSTSSGTETFLTSVGGSTFKFRDQTATAGTRYYYKVSAVNAVGEGPLSAEDSVRSG